VNPTDTDVLRQLNERPTPCRTARRSGAPHRVWVRRQDRWVCVSAHVTRG